MEWRSKPSRIQEPGMTSDSCWRSPQVPQGWSASASVPEAVTRALLGLPRDQPVSSSSRRLRCEMRRQQTSGCGGCVCISKISRGLLRPPDRAPSDARQLGGIECVGRCQQQLQLRNVASGRVQTRLELAPSFISEDEPVQFGTPQILLLGGRFRGCRFVHGDTLSGPSTCRSAAGSILALADAW